MPRRVIEGAVLVVLGFYLFGHTLPRAWRTLNTDFPNYYLAAKLTREGVDPARAYEWIWLQREKDHRAIDQRVVGLVPITPFSTLAIWPLTGMAPLAAKNAWLIFNLLLLFPIAWLMRAISGLSLLQIGCLFGMCFPLQRNLLYGQYYIVLLGILTAACWAAQRQRNSLAGSLVALGVAVKIFPVILTLHFIRKKNWAAVFAGVLTGILCVLVSVWVFGWSLHRTYLLQVLPWTVRGEVLDPYNLGSSSLSTLLHRLFIFEPQWNAHPALHAPWLLAILHPALQLGLLVPAVLWIDTRVSSPARISLEWSALLLATLTFTPLPASYHFTVLILPVAVLCGQLMQERRWILVVVVLGLFLAVGYPGWNTAPVDGWEALLHVKRLYALVLLTAVALYLMRHGRAEAQDNEERWWLAGAAAALAVSIVGGLAHQRGLFDDYAYRLPIPQQALLAAQPVLSDEAIQYIALLPSGYRRATIDGVYGGERGIDALAIAAHGDELWTETVGVHSVLEPSAGSGPSIPDAESPALVANGTRLAFLREINGRKQLFARDLSDPRGVEQQLTSSWNLEEIAGSPNGTIIVSATRDQGESRLYTVRGVDQLEIIPVGEARYPSISPDGRWLAYSGFVSGNWNLFLREFRTGEVRRLTTALCNQIEPAWLGDSKTLVYGSDCGRALWFTAICRRRVL
ncbi:MAG: glycosyltransferase 87 family protein [Acidobacteriaceae bacterium]